MGSKKRIYALPLVGFNMCCSNVDLPDWDGPVINVYDGSASSWWSREEEEAGSSQSVIGSNVLSSNSDGREVVVEECIFSVVLWWALLAVAFALAKRSQIDDGARAPES